MKRSTSSKCSIVLLALFALICWSVTTAIAQEATTGHPLTLKAGFESLTPGPLAEGSDDSGTWNAEANQVVVHTAHRRSGKASLRLLGGTEREVIWTPNSFPGRADRLEFWFERWTARSPFAFQVDLLVDGHWQTAYNAPGNAPVGGFKNHVSIPLPGKLPKQIRFRSTTPSSSGVMIDDLVIEPSMPKRVESITARQRTVPLLLRNEWNPVFDVTVNVQGNEGGLMLEAVEVALSGSIDLSAIDKVEVIASASPRPAWFNIVDLKNHADLTLFGSSTASSSEMKLQGHAPLNRGENHFLVSVKLKESADVSQTLRVSCPEVTISGKQHRPVATEESSPLQIGHALRRAGDDGVNTYRIPGLATTKAGTLIAVYDVRYRNGGDLPGDIDVGMSRSTDGGRSWEPMKIVMNMGDDPKWRYDGIGDPAVMVDKQTGSIWVAALWSHGNRAWHGSGQGMSPEKTGQFVLVRSDDDGLSWSEPIGITEQIKNSEWNLLFNGPGKGICMEDGTLVFAAQYRDKDGVPHSTIVYSQDHGKSWEVGAGAHPETTEAQVVEVRPGVLMLNCRYNKSRTRVVMISDDLGATWQEHASSKKLLIEPGACMASLIDVDQELGEELGGWLLFSNPDSLGGRENITIKASSDGGNNWPQDKRLLLDEGLGAGYSCMTMIDRDTVGILYEGSTSKLVFQRIPVKDIILRQSDHREKNDTKKVLQIPKVFGSHMVLQREQPLPVWGWAKSETKVVVTLDGASLETMADRDGNWKVQFPAREATAQPIQLVISTDDKTVRFEDILVGDVWFCAGQSNMAWPLHATNHGVEEIAAADIPTIRLLNLIGGAPGVPGTNGEKELARLCPEDYKQGRWAVASPIEAKDFSAVAWYFGREIHRQLDVPIGLINVGSGGSPASAWIRRNRLAEDPRFHALVDGNWLENSLLSDFCRRRGWENLLPAMQSGIALPGDELGPNHPFKPGFLWEAAVQPMLPFAIRGVLWYQGESNAETHARAVQYRSLLPILIQDWRDQWGRHDLPFLFVQLPAIERPDWPVFREGQRRIAEEMVNVGMAITIDTGDRNDVHPRDKKVVGQRLARIALGDVYRDPSVSETTGPLLKSMKIDNESIWLAFQHVGDGLVSYDQKSLRHFEIAGADRHYFPATATVEGNRVRITSTKVPQPKFARYAWIAYPDTPVNLYNRDGFPASPFSTDEAVFQKNNNEVVNR